MSVRDFALRLAAVLFCTTAIHAQTSLPPAVPPVAADPLTTLPASSLTQAQVETMQKKLADWPQLGRYREENATLAPQPGRVVFFGDSITDAWGRRAGTFFPGKPYVNRGISGQTTPQMLVRFQQDVVALKPAAVLILAGTNDIAGNTGLSTLPMIEDNFRSMVAIAKANNIRVILASVLPTTDYPWRKGLHPSEKVQALNAWLRSFAGEQHCIYLDYYSALADKDGGMKTGTSQDGVHPTGEGYAIMAPLAEAAIGRALQP